MSQPKPPGPPQDDGAKTVVGGPTLDPELLSALQRELRAETSKRGHILVVDPDPTHTVARLLEGAGFSVRITDDGVEATQLLASHAYDAALTDLGARELGGLDLLRFVREQDRDLPVLLMTAAPDFESAAQAVEHGAFQYLLKPVPADRLVGAIDRAVKERRLARDRSRALESMSAPPTEESSKLDDLRRWTSALDKLWMAYQPIVLPGGKLYAYEALVRSDEPLLRGAGELLDMADQIGGMKELGRAVRKLAGAFAVRASGAHYTFVNLHADDLSDSLLTDVAEPLSQVAPAIVLEITERAALHDVEAAKVKMSELRSIGYRIALDDLGAGYAGLTAFAQLRPDVVKLDMALVQGIDKDPVKRKIVASVTHVCRDMGITIVGEGVETLAERDILAELGCNLLQGYFFGKPQRL